MLPMASFGLSRGGSRRPNASLEIGHPWIGVEGRLLQRSQNDEDDREDRREVADDERDEGQAIAPPARPSGLPSGLVPQNDSGGPEHDGAQQRQDGREV